MISSGRAAIFHDDTFNVLKREQGSRAVPKESPRDRTIVARQLEQVVSTKMRKLFKHFSAVFIGAQFARAGEIHNNEQVKFTLRLS